MSNEDLSFSRKYCKAGNAATSGPESSSTECWAYPSRSLGCLSTTPQVGFSEPVKIFMMVDFPRPFKPRRPPRKLGCMVMLRCSTMLCAAPGYLKETSLAEMSDPGNRIGSGSGNDRFISRSFSSISIAPLLVLCHPGRSLLILNLQSHAERIGLNLWETWDNEPGAFGRPLQPPLIIQFLLPRFNHPRAISVPSLLHSFPPFLDALLNCLFLLVLSVPHLDPRLSCFPGVGLIFPQIPREI
jgi:hypothetical protein